mmetsp:Transcript_34490/g.63621  ORF Transcript_34490/g.63621 Transcript_34490/m.63621 type:complete len:207 (+) Transcript_34490:654-1274(+)
MLGRIRAGTAFRLFLVGTRRTSMGRCYSCLCCIACTTHCAHVSVLSRGRRATLLFFAAVLAQFNLFQCTYFVLKHHLTLHLLLHHGGLLLCLEGSTGSRQGGRILIDDRCWLRSSGCSRLIRVGRGRMRSWSQVMLGMVLHFMLLLCLWWWCRWDSLCLLRNAWMVHCRGSSISLRRSGLMHDSRLRKWIALHKGRLPVWLLLTVM